MGARVPRRTPESVDLPDPNRHPAGAVDFALGAGTCLLPGQLRSQFWHPDGL